MKRALVPIAVVVLVLAGVLVFTGDDDDDTPASAADRARVERRVSQLYRCPRQARIKATCTETDGGGWSCDVEPTRGAGALFTVDFDEDHPEVSMVC